MADRPRAGDGRRGQPPWQHAAPPPASRPAGPRQRPPAAQRPAAAHRQSGEVQRPAARRPAPSRSSINPPRKPPTRRPPTKTQPRNVPKLAGQMILSVVSVLVLAFTGYAWAQLSGFDDLEKVDIGLDTGPKPADGSRDILLVGMDSRTDAQGNPLPRTLLQKFKAGHDKGEQNTDTMILLHIPNDGSKAVAVSFPRDSYVAIAQDYGQHKLNSAYGRAKVVTTREMQEAGETDQKKIFRESNKAGANLLIETIEELTGRTIDNYASINLLGFYEITQAVGGVEVCLKNATQDNKSGADFPAGKQTVSGVQALAFVRQRQNLPRGDLDRVVRQQVFMAGLARKIISAGTLTDPGKLGQLQEAIKKSVVLNEGWDIVDFARQMSGLSGGQVQFQTIPVGGDISTADGDALQVDPTQVQQFIAGLSKGQKKPPGQPDPANAEVTVDVMNGTGITGLAAKVLESLGGSGFTKGVTGDVDTQETTVVKHAPGEEAAAQKVIAALAGPATAQSDPAIAPGKVNVLIGLDYPQDGGGGGDTNGGGSQPAGDEPTDPGTSTGTSTSGQPQDEKPITAGGVRCVN